MSRGALAILPSGSTPTGFTCRNLSDVTKAVPQILDFLDVPNKSTLHFVKRASFEYDVFLSFRGEDTRKGLVDHLRHGLVSAGIRVFNDDRDLLSKQIGPGLSQAINNSKIAIPIISKNYGGSKWCLDELRQIMRCHTEQGQVVLPIFDGIDVSDVRELTGEFGKAFRELANHHTAEQVKEWEEALRYLAKIRGWSSQEVVDGHQGQLVNMVVEKVLSVLSKGTSGKKMRECIYDVFPISSPAIKKKLASLLSHILEREKISVFRDDDQYLIGKDYNCEVRNAMDHCKIFVVVISKDFASSCDCLNKLAQMFECIKKNGQKILPIFYEVDPSQKKEFWDHFWRDIQQHNAPEETYQRWQDYFSRVRSVGGLVSANIGNGDEGKLVIRAIEKVHELLGNRNA